MTPTVCANCDAPLTGPYCAQCGQHAHESARTLGALLHDAWHVITHVDGRFWATLRLLLFRPGQLTVEYFAERRARYVPPVRLYLVISIVFFGLWSVTGRLRPESLVTEAIGDRPAAAELAEIRRDAKQAALEARRQAAAAAAATAPPAPAAPAAPAAPPTADASRAPSVPAARGAAGAEDEDLLNIDLKDCDKVHSATRWLEDALKESCRRGVADHGRSIGHAVFANIPKMMFVFLPLIAVVMLLLYWFPRHYYVEHLVFFLHNHAALFLAMSLEMLLGALARAVPALDRAASIGAFAVFGYALWYVYRSMRRYYGNGRWLTLAKLSLVSLAYLVFLATTLIGTFVVSALIA